MAEREAQRHPSQSHPWAARTPRGPGDSPDDVAWLSFDAWGTIGECSDALTRLLRREASTFVGASVASLAPTLPINPQTPGQNIARIIFNHVDRAQAVALAIDAKTRLTVMATVRRVLRGRSPHFVLECRAIAESKRPSDIEQSSAEELAETLAALRIDLGALKDALKTPDPAVTELLESLDRLSIEAVLSTRAAADSTLGPDSSSNIPKNATVISRTPRYAWFDSHGLRCETGRTDSRAIDRREVRLAGFDVVYQRAGRIFTEWMPSNPGNRIGPGFA